jgi:predicted RNase H-related nuclease YkuK (DUF458 family)
MKRAEQLREYARVLRVMATTLDISSIRDRLLNLAAMSEELASTIETAIKERQSAPIDITSKRPPDIH